MEIDVTKCRFHSTNNGFTGAYCTAHNNYCRHIRNCYYKQLHRYKQFVKEIKEIAEEYEELHGFLDCSGDLILQKISEVENE